jgi:hypothetical protein
MQRYNTRCLGAFKMFDTKQRGYLENKEISELLLFLFTCER